MSKSPQEEVEQSTSVEPSSAPFEITLQLRERINDLLAANPVLLFLKGSPQKPRCKFSRQCVELLRKNNIHFCWFDILQDNDIRQGLKIMFDWPTYPQLYANGKLLGGFDVVEQLAESNELLSLLPAQQLTLDERLHELVSMAPVMLFMKGTPDEPQCGFSAQLVELLNAMGIPCGAFDVLSDEEVREGLKSFSGCQTYPQLYCRGQLIGGLDTVHELAQQGKLHQHLGILNDTEM